MNNLIKQLKQPNNYKHLANTGKISLNNKFDKMEQFFGFLM